MKKSFNKGFTLIELLVVIAIIGILSGAVLTSLNSARNKAKTTRIISAVSQMRIMMETNSNLSGQYNTVSGVDYNALNNDVKTQQGTGSGMVQNDGKGQALSNSSSYCVKASYNNTGTGNGWCVDSNGNSLETDVSGKCTNTSNFCK